MWRKANCLASSTLAPPLFSFSRVLLAFSSTCGQDRQLKWARVYVWPLKIPHRQPRPHRQQLLMMVKSYFYRKMCTFINASQRLYTGIAVNYCRRHFHTTRCLDTSGRFLNPSTQLRRQRRVANTLRDTLDGEVKRLEREQAKTIKRNALVEFYKKSAVIDKNFKEQLGLGSMASTIVSGSRSNNEFFL